MYKSKEQKISDWLNKTISFGKYKHQKFGDILKTEEGVKYLLYLSKWENLNASLKYIILKLIDFNNQETIKQLKK